MRIRRLTIDGFRAFGSRYEFDLDVGVVLLEGANGQGKTSFFDAILWCLAGTVPRLESKGDSAIVSRYSRSGEANVIVEWEGADGPVSVSRWTNGSDEKVVLKEEQQDAFGPRAELRLLDLLWPGISRSSGQEGQSVATAFTRSIYLQQDRLRDFLEADSDRDRFAAISELVGTGRVTDLQEGLAKARTAWSRRLNTARTESEELGRDVARLKAQVDELGEESAPGMEAEEAWATWWQSAIRFIELDEHPSLTRPSAGSMLEEATRLLVVRRRNLRTQRDTAERLATDLASQLSEQVPPLAELESTAQRLSEEIKAKEEELEALFANLRDARMAYRERLAAIVQSRDRTRRQRALAELALALLGDRCPVCHQGIDEETVRIRLEELVDAQDGTEVVAPDEAVSRLEGQIGVGQSQLDQLRDSLTRSESDLRFRRQSQEQLKADLQSLEISTTEPSEDLVAKVRSVADDLAGDLQRLERLIGEAEDLALSQARASERSRLTELREELNERQRELAASEDDIKKRDRTSTVVNALVATLEEVASELVSRRLDVISPVLQRIYSRMDPHPSFRDVSLVARTHYGKGRVTAEITDRVEGVVVEDPHLVLSSSQSNVLALSIFLALNLGTQVPLDVTLLDDPVQSLDDVNLLGLTDLLRRVRDRRQVFLSTHDERLRALLTRKLRPVDETQRVRILRFEGWERNGPTILASDVERSSGNLRVVA
jgi:DNA repair exonuclease SbcCD ATPase subunit